MFYEIGKVFRNAGRSVQYNPSSHAAAEFDEAYADCEDVMRMVEQLVAFAAEQALGTATITVEGRAHRVGRRGRIPLGQAIAERTGIDPLADPTRDPEPLRVRLQADGIDTSRDRTWAALVDHLLSHDVEPHLEFQPDVPRRLSRRALAALPPASRRSLARRALRGLLRRHGDRHGFSELNDPDINQPRALRGAGGRGAGGRRRVAPGRRGLRRGAARPIRRRAASAWASTGSRC